MLPRRSAMKTMGMKRPDLKSSSVSEFTSIADGTYFGATMDAMQAYGHVMNYNENLSSHQQL